MIIEISNNGTTINSMPCHWCGDEVLIDEDNLPESKQWKFYPEGKLAVYCCSACGLREYDFMYQHNPDSLSVNGEIPPEMAKSLINH